MWISRNIGAILLCNLLHLLHHMQCDGAFRLCKKGLVKFTPEKGSISPNFVHQAKKKLHLTRNTIQFYLHNISIYSLFVSVCQICSPFSKRHAPINNSHLLRFAKSVGEIYSQARCEPSGCRRRLPPTFLHFSL